MKIKILFDIVILLLHLSEYPFIVHGIGKFITLSNEHGDGHLAQVLNVIGGGLWATIDPVVFKSSMVKLLESISNHDLREVEERVEGSA